MDYNIEGKSSVERNILGEAYSIVQSGVQSAYEFTKGLYTKLTKYATAQASGEYWIDSKPFSLSNLEKLAT